MITLNSTIMGVAKCYARFIYYNQRSHPNHRGLTCIDVVPWHITDVHHFVVKANQSANWPRDLRKVKCIEFSGGSTHGAFLSPAESDQWFVRFAEQLGLEFAIFAAHRRASGRFDFHVLACTFRDGRKRTKREITKLARTAARNATEELNEARLAAGNRLTTGNLSENREVYFLRPPATPEPVPEPAPKLAPEPATAPATAPAPAPVPETEPPAAPVPVPEISPPRAPSPPTRAANPGAPTKPSLTPDAKPTTRPVTQPLFPAHRSRPFVDEAYARRKREQDELAKRRLQDEAKQKAATEQTKRLWRDLLQWLRLDKQFELDDAAPRSWSEYALQHNFTRATLVEIPELVRTLSRARVGKSVDTDELELEEEATRTAGLRLEECAERYLDSDMDRT